RRRHFAAVLDGRFARASMNAGGVAHASVMQDIVASRGTTFEAVGDIERQNRRKFFHRQWILAAYSGDVSHQAASARWHADPGQVRNYLDGSADDAGIQSSLRR